MVKYIHFITIGKEDNQLHLAGIPKFSGEEAVLFTTINNRKKLDSIKENLSHLGLGYRVIFVKESYADAYRKANDEASAYFDENTCIAVNITTGSRIIVSAIEDAVRIQLYYFHKRTYEKKICSAFRYIIERKNGKLIFKIAPIWNFTIKDFNDIFDALIEINNPASSKELYDLIYLRSYTGGYEAFRKTFRRFLKWFKNQPCFKEETGKAPKYKIDL